MKNKRIDRNASTLYIWNQTTYPTMETMYNLVYHLRNNFTFNVCWIGTSAKYLTLQLLDKLMHENGTLGDGTTEKVFMILSGYSSRILLMRRVPIPEPVPPPSECVSWNPCRQSQLSASLRTTSKTESTSSAPSV